MSADDQMFLPLQNAGQGLPCGRCRRACVIAPARDPGARPIRLADGPGLCANCALTVFMRTEMDIEELLPAGVAATTALRMPHVQEGFRRILQVGRADAAIQQIDWETIIANWDLPLPKTRRSRRR